MEEEEEKKKGYEKIFEEIIYEKFPNLGKEITMNVKEAQSPTQDKPKEEHTEPHIMQTNKNIKKKIKSNKGKATNNIQGNPLKVIS